MREVPSDLREKLARIDWMIAETQKFQVEQIKLQSEAQKYTTEQNKRQMESLKLMAEQNTLQSEARKLDRDRTMAPWQVAVVTMDGIAALLGGAVTMLKGPGIL